MATIEKTSKPISIEWNHEWDGSHGKVHDFDIEFEDGTIGQFSTTKRNQDKFTVGKEVNYTVTDRTGNFGPKIDIAKDPNAGKGGTGGARSGGGGGYHAMTPEVEASITMSVCLDCAALVIIKSGKAGQVKEDLVALHQLANKFFNHIYEKCKGDHQKSINYQSRLKEVTTFFMDPVFTELKITNSESILKYVDLEVEFLQLKMSQATK